MKPRTIYLLIGCGQLAVWLAFAIWPPIIFAIGALFAGAWGIFLIVRMANSWDDPRHAKRPPDAP